MKKLISVSPFIGLLTLSSSNALGCSGECGCGPCPVPEIDGGMAAIAIGLTLGMVALVREHRRKK